MFFSLYPYSSYRLRCFVNHDRKNQVIRSLHSNYDTLRQKVTMEQVDVRVSYSSIIQLSNNNQTTKRRIKENFKPSDGE